MRGDSVELSRIAAEARLIAEAAEQDLSSAHLLLGLFTVPNPADLVLRARGIDETALLKRSNEMPPEPEGTVASLLERARELARGTGAVQAQALHLLVAIARARGTAAHTLLARAGLVPADIAREALAYAVGPLPRRFIPREVLEERAAAPRLALASSPPPARRAGGDAREPTAIPTPRGIPAARPTITLAEPRPAAGVAEPTAAPSPRERPAPPTTPPRAAPSGAPPPPGDAQRASRLSAIRRIAEGAAEVAVPWALSAEEFPYLAALGRNLTELAAEGRIDPVVDRDREIEQVLEILGKRRSNNPVLVGEPGVGKTAVVEGVARRLVETEAPGSRLIIELDVAGLVAGTHLRGSLSEKLNGIKEEVRRASGRVVVFIDEIHMLVGAGATGDGSQDAAGELKAALARGEFPCVGATTYAEFHRHLAQDPALERRFVPVRVDEPSVPRAVEILRGVAARYAEHHGVTFEDEALQAAATLSARYVRDRCLPDKALAVLDHAGSRARREGVESVGRELVARVVARMAGLPEERVLPTDAERILRLDEELSRRVIGHREIVTRVAASVRRNFAGFSGTRPLASFIFLGPTGVGKTELARSLAEVLFGGEDALVRVDMSELSEGHAVARLLGAPPGYVGYGEGGQLTEAVRKRPASVVLFDEIEKAHRDSQQILLQLLDEGHVTDSRGRKVDFTSAVVILTSNLGSEAFAARSERAVGFGREAGDGDRASRALAAARAAFPPELWNRIEERLVFAPLGRADLGRIATLLASKSSARLEAEKQIRFELSPGAVEHLLENGGHDPELGARPLRQAIARLVEAPLAEQILRGYVSPGDRLQVVLRGGGLHFEHLTVLDTRRATSPDGAGSR